MNDAERNALSTMRDCWISGGAAATMAPPEWQDIIAATPVDEAERMLLAIAGQAFDIGFRPAAPAALNVRPSLPKLDLPSIPDQHRSLFRSALKNAGDNESKMRVVAVAEARGYVAHPLDWMPPASAVDAPRAYAPWVDWQQVNAGVTQTLEPLSAENWDEFYPAARRNALADLRRADPAAARTLLEAKAATESAEVRFPLIELLRIGLSAADVPYLQSLSADRSSKVKQLAARLLGRLGQAGSVEPDVKELADFIEKSRTGLLRRRDTFSLKKLKNYAQTNRRSQLFDAVQLVDLAQELETTEHALIEGWRLSDTDGDASFAHMVCESGSDASVAQLRDALLKARNVEALALLLPRLDANHQREFVKAVLARGSVHGRKYEEYAVPGSFDTAELTGSKLYQAMRNLYTAHQDTNRTVPDFSLFGYLATTAAAQAILTDLIAAGLASADPPLALLRLNAALADR